jgi:hypothetical protein
LSLATMVREPVAWDVPWALAGQAMARIDMIAATIASSRADLASIIGLSFLRSYAR